MENMDTLQNIVAQVLKENPIARDSDTELYIRVCKVINPVALKLTLEDALGHREELGLPKFDSCGRARRKLQEKHKELRASRAVEKERAELYEEMKEWAIS